MESNKEIAYCLYHKSIYIPQSCFSFFSLSTAITIPFYINLYASYTLDITNVYLNNIGFFSIPWFTSLIHVRTNEQKIMQNSFCVVIPVFILISFLEMKNEMLQLVLDLTE